MSAAFDRKIHDPLQSSRAATILSRACRTTLTVRSDAVNESENGGQTAFFALESGVVSEGCGREKGVSPRFFDSFTASQGSPYFFACKWYSRIATL